MLEVLLTFNSFDVQKIHYSICNERSSTNMATGRNSFRTVELAFGSTSPFERTVSEITEPTQHYAPLRCCPHLLRGLSGSLFL